MAAPEFSKLTIDTLAKRARFLCSNPDCGAHTVGPNNDPSKATTIGEAAHIMGAHPGAKRFDASMSDVTRAAITNGIWLCRNCHGQIDRDDKKYPPELLFAWRKDHEERAARELGSRGDRIRHDIKMASLDFLSKYPSIIQRIVIDKPRGWEWRFTAELMRYLNNPEFKRFKNLRDGCYYKPQPRISGNQFNDWLQERMHIMSNVMRPMTPLMTRLSASWGAPGEAGNIEEIYDVCVLIRDALCVIVDLEETLHFANIPDEANDVREVLINVVGKNIIKLDSVPNILDEVVEIASSDHEGTREEPLMINHSLVFDLPDDFVERFEDAFSKYALSLGLE